MPDGAGVNNKKRGIKMNKNKTYKIELPRGQYDRIYAIDPGIVLETVENNIDHWDYKKDTITFTISEKQRERWAKHAKENVNHLYWVCQMFLPQNFKKYIV